MKVKCKWCGKKIDARGMPSHEFFRHRRMIARAFSLEISVMVMFWLDGGLPPHFEQKQLSAPNPLTVYSKRPLGYMAAPIPEHRRPKGYTPPQGYSTPCDALRGQILYGKLMF